MRCRITILLALLNSLFVSSAGEVTHEAMRIHRDAIVIDGHNDFPWEMRTKLGMSFETVDMTRFITNFHTDIPRLKQGGVGAQFWAVYVPTLTMKTGGAARQTLEQIDLVHRMVAKYPETFAWAGTADEIVTIRKSGKIACLIGIEGGHSIENSLALLRIYYQLGARYMTLTHSDSLPWADAATDKPLSNGLNDFGRDVINEMNRLGMMVDISHVAPATMRAALDASKAPVIASHSSAYAVAPHPRNIPDDVLLRIKMNNGLVMVNFFSGFVVAESAKIMSRVLEVTRELREQYPDEKEYEKAMREWRRANPMPAGSVKDLVNHIDHIVKIAGIDHVGLGSDYDGVSKTPVELPDVSSYPVITQELLDRKYSEADIKKILGENLLRVMRDSEKVAREMNR